MKAKINNTGSPNTTILDGETEQRQKRHLEFAAPVFDAHGNSIPKTTLPKLGETTTFDKGNIGVVKGKDTLNPNTPFPTVGIAKCDPIRSKLNDLEERLKHIRKFDKSELGERPRISDEWAEVNALVSKTRFALRACEAPFLPPPPPPPPAVPLTLTLTNFVCLDQSDDIRILFGFNTEDDEPYAVVFAVDLKIANLAVASLPFGAINSKMTLIGALADVNEGEEVSAPGNVIWGLSNAPDIVTSANNLIVLVAMMENDDGSPDQVRTVLEKAAQASLFSNLPAFTSLQIPRQELVSRIIADMNGAMGAAKVGVPNPDDNIGAIQELRFFQFELDDVYRNRGPVEKSLTFEGDDAKYILKFKMFR